MSRKTLIAALCLAALAVGIASAQTSQELAEQVRGVEKAFARSMTERDFDAFVSHLSAETVFLSRQGALRGPEAVKGVWQGFYEGKEAPFSWAPEQVEVLDSGTLALSSGPVLDPAGKRMGTYNSVWRREGDGVWRIVFDKGCPPCDCGSAKP